jgi:hypothetical protein
MKYLNQVAASVYMGLCRESLYIGLIGMDTFLTRIGALRQMCDPESQIWAYANLFESADDLNKYYSKASFLLESKSSTDQLTSLNDNMNEMKL